MNVTRFSELRLMLVSILEGLRSLGEGIRIVEQNRLKFQEHPNVGVSEQEVGVHVCESERAIKSWQR